LQFWAISGPDHNFYCINCRRWPSGGHSLGGIFGQLCAGAFLLVLRPFKVGDFITAGGLTGTGHEIGLFVTSFDTPDNERTFVGNNKILSDTIQNYTLNPYRRVELTAPSLEPLIRR
jgi:small conductance mechanosensitive channel